MRGCRRPLLTLVLLLAAAAAGADAAPRPGSAVADSAAADGTTADGTKAAGTKAAGTKAAAPAGRPAPQFTLASSRVSPTVAVFTSAVFPGWGQLATDNAWRAALAFGFEGWFLARLVMFDRKAVRYRQRIEPLFGTNRFPGAYDVNKEQWELKRDNAWWAGGALFIIALDAYVGAHLDRFEEDPVPVPDAWDPGALPQPIELPPPPAGGAPVLRLSAGF